MFATNRVLARMSYEVANARIEKGVITEGLDDDLHMLSERGSEGEIASRTFVNAWYGQNHRYVSCQNTLHVRNRHGVGIHDGEQVERVWHTLSRAGPAGLAHFSLQ
eukprot:CAMPEP_0119412596 /NCGR_PEP_ID=MMETSP1335-20130426/4984_1 /TAXON_ID=259385 /ORGANISM="Chrysoculter rhomboideus, Strain RCC1486" /LENGTH=105 /DNA_ID=CAMNT_0007437349 /DNA_START=95 /DNA_END=412 /DNA_ORIENTATION=+